MPYGKRTAGELPKPWVQITIWRKRGTPEERFVKVPAILDSGADCTVINADYASRLGVDLETDAEKTPAVVMGGGQVNCYIVRGLELQFAQDYIPSDVLFVARADESHDEVSDEEQREEESVVGREGFFSLYLIAFDQAKLRFFVGRPDEIATLAESLDA